MFKVVPDQLKISDGWVRCGHCADVFDATLYLEQWDAPESDPATEARGSGSDLENAPASSQAHSIEAAMEAFGETDSALTVPMPLEEDDEGEWLHQAPDDVAQPMKAVDGDADNIPVSENHAPQEDEQTQSRSDGQDLQAGHASPGGHVGATEMPSTPGGADDFKAELERFAATSSLRKDKDPKKEPEAAPVSVVPAVAPDSDPEPDSEHEPEVSSPAVSEPGFMRQARRQAFWRSPAMRALQLLIAAGLALLLVVQWSTHERDQLASRFPALTPWLAAMCQPVGCTLQAPRRIEAVVIDSSTLVRRLGNFYSFDLVLKNSAPMAVAMPALELSLTNTADAVIARRVFLAEELPGAPTVVPAHGSLALSLRLSLADAGVDAMSGYRALVFYP